MMMGDIEAVQGRPSGETTDAVAMRLRLIGQMEAWTLRSESVLPLYTRN